MLHLQGGPFSIQGSSSGLKVAQKVFRKLLIAPVASLRLQGIQIYPYLDDILVKSSLWQQAQQHIRSTMDCLSRVGFMVNLKKSSLTSKTSIEHLGLQINTEDFTIAVSAEFRQAIFRAVKQTLRSETADVTDLASLLGMLVSCQDLDRWAHFHMRPLQHALLPFQASIERQGIGKSHFPQSSRTA